MTTIGRRLRKKAATTATKKFHSVQSRERRRNGDQLANQQEEYNGKGSRKEMAMPSALTVEITERTRFQPSMASMLSSHTPRPSIQSFLSVRSAGVGICRKTKTHLIFIEWSIPNTGNLSPFLCFLHEDIEGGVAVDANNIVPSPSLSTLHNMQHNLPTSLIIVANKVFEDGPEFISEIQNYHPKSVLYGYNGTVMAYGQTGTGKTFTLGRLGEDDTAARGIMVRSMDSLADIFPESNSFPVSYMQLYMDSIQDLLDPTNDNIPIVEDPKTGHVSLPGATLVEIRYQHCFVELLRVGEAHHFSANAKLNTESSRSHAILMVRIKRSVEGSEVALPTENGNGSRSIKSYRPPLVRKGKFVVVDLTGSECIDKSGVTGDANNLVRSPCLSTVQNIQHDLPTSSQAAANKMVEDGSELKVPQLVIRLGKAHFQVVPCTGLDTMNKSSAVETAWNQCKGTYCAKAQISLTLPEFISKIGCYLHEEEYYHAKSVVDGYNGTVMAYGQTDTGKTFTHGRLGEEDTAARGIMVRSMEDILADISPESDSIPVSYLQLYMESIQGLLDPTNDNIPIVEDLKTGDVSLPGATLVEIRYQHSFLELLRVGEAHRFPANTEFNTESSLSHAILTVHIKRSVEGSEVVLPTENVNGSHSVKSYRSPLVRKVKFVVVDPAGSECIDKSGSEVHTLEEAKSINLSVSALGECINALEENSPHMPVRDSKLTRLLRDSFWGTVRTSLIVTFGQSLHHRGDTSIITFGRRAMKLENMVKVNELFDYRNLSRRLDILLDKLIAEHERQQKSLQDEPERITMEAHNHISKMERNCSEALEVGCLHVCVFCLQVMGLHGLTNFSHFW